MKNIFNDYVQTLETYIMFKIKAKTAELTYMVDYNKCPVDAKERYDRTFIMSLGYKI